MHGVCLACVGGWLQVNMLRCVCLVVLHANSWAYTIGFKHAATILELLIFEIYILEINT